MVQDNDTNMGEPARIEKASDAFRTISEVAEELGLPQHVLRFWETKFTQIRPMKRGGGRRYYRPEDVNLLRGIQYLLYGEGYTIKGVQRILKEQGARVVAELWRHPGEPLPASPAAAGAADGAEDDDAPFTGDEPEHGEAETEDLLERAGLAPRREAPPVAPVEDDLPAGILPEAAPQRGSLSFMDRLRGIGEQGGLSREDVRRLQSTLFELLECKRLLDQTR